MSNQTSKVKPPIFVAVAVWLLVASFLLGYLQVVLNKDWHFKSNPLISITLITLFVFLIARGLYRGRNWLRWLSVALISIGIVTAPWALEQRDYWGQITYITQCVMQGLAVFLLLLPPSGKWFRSNNSFKPKPLRGSA
jgi:hypothetical protein